MKDSSADSGMLFCEVKLLHVVVLKACYSSSSIIVRHSPLYNYFGVGGA